MVKGIDIPFQSWLLGQRQWIRGQNFASRLKGSSNGTPKRQQVKQQKYA
jgi:hypothetical protein